MDHSYHDAPVSKVRNPNTFSSSFQPAWWLQNGHLQTIVPALRRIDPLERLRSTLETPDGDFLDLDWKSGWRKDLVILVHGISGSSGSNYILGMQKALLDAGFRTVAMNFRGCSGRPNDRARAYHSGETGDLDHVYREIRRKEPDTAIAVVGFSLGGNVLLKWLGEKGDALDLFGAVAVSVPFELIRCADHMDSSISRLYRDLILRDLKRYMETKHRHLESLGLLGEANRIKALGDLSGIDSFWEYDERVIAPLFGFANARDYYERSSSRRFLRSIAAPTLVLQSLDDPFFVPEIIPEANELAACVRLEVSPNGGHLGFISTLKSGKPQFWLETKIPEYLQTARAEYSRI